MATPQQQPDVNQTQKSQPQQGQAPYAPEKQSPPNPNPNKGELMGQRGNQKQNLDSSQSHSQLAANEESNQNQRSSNSQTNQPKG